MFARSRDWIIIFSLRKNLSTLQFQPCRFLKHYVFDCTRYRATEKNIFKELGLSLEGSLQGFSFCPPKTYKPNKQTTRNTSHLHGIACSCGKLAYDKLFADFYDIKKMNAELFAEGFETFSLLTFS